MRARSRSTIPTRSKLPSRARSSTPTSTARRECRPPSASEPRTDSRDDRSVYIKQERWQRALDAATAAKKYDEDNAKALFREGQARIGLGEINTGKRILEDLQVKNGPDAAITAALQKLAADEKKREEAKNAQFRGMFNRKNGSEQSSKEKPAEGKAATAEASGPAAGETATLEEEEEEEGDDVKDDSSREGAATESSKVEEPSTVA